MQASLSNIVGAINTALWGYLLIYALIGVGLFFTVYLGAPQITKFGAAFKSVFGGLFAKKEKDAQSLSQFQALAVAISAQIGTGNVAGVATAIVSGGPGAIFWMWVSAFLGMGTIFAEALLAQKYRVISHGKYIGGPAFYITHGLTKKIGRGKARFLSGFFSIALIIALGFIGNATQANSIAGAVHIAFGLPEIAVGLVLAAAAGIGMKEAVRYGVARGLFSNEAGMGSTPHAHATANVAHPALQGMAAFVGVFIDTILVCTATALIILLTEANTLGLNGAAVTQQAFSMAFGGWGAGLLAVCLTFFAFTTIIGWYYFGESNVRFLFKGRFLNGYRALVLLAIVLGTLGKVDLVWALSDMFNGFMVIPNLIALFLLRGEIKAVYDDYLAKVRAGKAVDYDYEVHEYHDK